jgi:hypothetical protein
MVDKVAEIYDDFSALPSLAELSETPKRATKPACPLKRGCDPAGPGKPTCTEHGLAIDFYIQRYIGAAVIQRLIRRTTNLSHLF